MKITQLIEKLTELKNIHHDIEVMVWPLDRLGPAEIVQFIYKDNGSEGNPKGEYIIIEV